MTVQVEGTAEVQRNLTALAGKYGQAIADAAFAGGQLVRGTAIQSIQSTSNGGEVTRSRLGGGQYTHTVSAEGDAPNTDTGRLVSSIQVEVEADDVFVGSTLECAGYLEFGTTRMTERPWLNPALEQNRRNIERLFQTGVNRVSRQDGEV